MRIAVVELMPSGHTEVVESLIHIHLSHPAHTIGLFATERITREMKAVFEHQTPVQFFAQPAEQALAEALLTIKQFRPDKIYIVTLERAIEVFAAHQWPAPVCFLIHNLDYWFTLSWGGSLLKCWQALQKPGGWHQWRFLLKIWLGYLPARQRWMAVLMQAPNRFAVISDGLLEELRQYVPAGQTEVVPAAVHLDTMTDMREAGQPLYICIPGYVTQVRRDYLGFFNWLAAHAGTFRRDLQVECLGRFDDSHVQTAQIRAAINRCREQGLTVITHEAFIPVKTFDEVLMRCDLILANVNTQRSGAYGASKDTGGIFMMIKSGKPGLAPAAYPAQPDIVPLLSQYADYDELGQLLQHFANDRAQLEAISQRARQCAARFSPAQVYQRIYPA